MLSFTVTPENDDSVNGVMQIKCITELLSAAHTQWEWDFNR